MTTNRGQWSVWMLAALLPVWVPAVVAAQEADVADADPSFAADHSADTLSADEHRSGQAADLAGLLAPLPGIYVQEAFRGSAAPVIRGLTGDRNLIFVDGVRFNHSLNGTFANAGAGTISPYAIDDITVVRGPSADRFGNGGMGGAIYLTTRDTDGLSRGPHGQGRFFFRSGDHTTGTALDGAGVSGTYSLLAGADYTDFGEIRSGGGDKEPFSSFERANWRARLSLLPQKSPLIVTGTYLGHFSNNLPRTDQLGLGRIATTDISDNLVYVSLDWRPQAALEKLGIKASYHQVTENATQDVCPVVGGADRIDMASCSSLQTAISAHGYRDVIDTFGLYADFGVRLLKERIRIGGSIEYYYDTIMSTRTELRTLNDVNELIEQTRGVYSSGSYYSRFGTDLHMDAVLATTRIGNLKAHLGGRVSHFAGYAPVVPERNEDIHYTHGGLVDSAGIQWLYRDNFNLYGLFSQGFRSPGLQETTALGYVAGQYQIPNPALKPERSYNFEVGSRLAVRPVELTIAWFHHRIDDFIDERPGVWGGRWVTTDGVPVVQRVNADEAVFQGVEGGVALHIFRVTAAAELSFIRGDIYDAPEGYFADLAGDVTRFPARRMPSLFGTGRLRYTDNAERFYAEVAVHWADSQDRLHPMDRQDLSLCETRHHSGDLDADCRSIGGWYTLNLRGGIRVSDNADVELAALNLNDAQYKPVGATYRAAGFDARGTLRIHF